VIFHSDDWAAIPFTLIWTACFVFWEADALGIWGRASRGGTDLFMALWGIPFLFVGNYMVWGRFLVDTWLKRRTYYGGDEPSRSNPARRMEAEDELDVSRGNSDDRARRDSYGDAVFGKKYPVIAGRHQKNTQHQSV
jgi:hypothetical protein